MGQISSAWRVRTPTGGVRGAVTRRAGVGVGARRRWDASGVAGALGGGATAGVVWLLAGRSSAEAPGRTAFGVRMSPTRGGVFVGVGGSL